MRNISKYVKKTIYVMLIKYVKLHISKYTIKKLLNILLLLTIHKYMKNGTIFAQLRKCVQKNIFTSL